MYELISPLVYVVKNIENDDYSIYSTVSGAIRAAVDAIEESYAGMGEEWFLHEAGEACGTPCKEALVRYFMARPNRLSDYGMSIESRCVRD